MAASPLLRIRSCVATVAATAASFGAGWYCRKNLSDATRLPEFYPCSAASDSASLSQQKVESINSLTAKHGKEVKIGSSAGEIMHMEHSENSHSLQSHSSANDDLNSISVSGEKFHGLEHAAADISSNKAATQLAENNSYQASISKPMPLKPDCDEKYLVRSVVSEPPISATPPPVKFLQLLGGSSSNWIQPQPTNPAPPHLSKKNSVTATEGDKATVAAADVSAASAAAVTASDIYKENRNRESRERRHFEAASNSAASASPHLRTAGAASDTTLTKQQQFAGLLVTRRLIVPIQRLQGLSRALSELASFNKRQPGFHSQTVYVRELYAAENAYTKKDAIQKGLSENNSTAFSEERKAAGCKALEVLTLEEWLDPLAARTAMRSEALKTLLLNAKKNGWDLSGEIWIGLGERSRRRMQAESC